MRDVSKGECVVDLSAALTHLEGAEEAKRQGIIMVGQNYNRLFCCL